MFLRLKAPELLPETDRQLELSIEDKKCGFHIVNSLKSNFASLTTDQQNLIEPWLSRPNLQKSIVSPSGFFRVHYDTTGGNVPSYNSGLTIDENVLEVINALEFTFNFEVDSLGFPSPPTDNGVGGDDRYDVYIENQIGGLYGYTEWENKISTNRWTTFIVLDDNYTGYFSSGVSGLKATVAHEFHHAIQLGSYGIENSNGPFRDSDVFFYEITSTAMEEFVYDDINDYYQYMDSYFRRTERAFSLQNGYNLAIWNIYLVKRFGFDLLKQQWELIPNQIAITAISNSLFIYGSSFPRELNEFGIWTHYTNYRSVPGLYFEEAMNYPLVSTTTTVQFTPPSQIANMSSAPVANNFVHFSVINNSDSLVAIVTNGDAGAAASNSNQFFPFQYTLFSNSTAGNRKLTDDYSSDFSAANNQFWSVSEILNNIVVRRDSIINPPAGSVSYAYPNPFGYNKTYLSGSFISFPLNADLGETVDFNIYSSAMQLVYSSEKTIQILPGDQRGVSWNGLDNDGKKLASGVYVYVTKSGDDVETGKVVIFNE
ncbi:MAG: hypothetical protein KJN64_15540 [Ignavibacteria bacterium]|nr:hypothetical protein [Ignavibacteria bacterium]MBT8382443.1 hypothetical protein [Ignavibacteria bacterium]MBT8392820.1 hypothetical protein [Ignavibacteria bacterium]NNJ53598.1 hypothetical protein [Ignavibacteriaceae bacterium]NNL20205.1 hypothetical protein [Ignavibacteriaceae bacterium]